MNNPVIIAQTAVEVGARVLQGEKGFAKITYTPPVCIAKENVAQYYDPNAVF